MNEDYMNGYNSCVEKMLQIISKEIASGFTGFSSISGTLLELRHSILISAYAYNDIHRVDSDKLSRQYADDIVNS